ncbi:hypothetical protein [Neisseria iguanae]|uniref:Uncharacterized protein n=1 Tax=Neisseria iguanae TaxID=90242 RepID=A0A2P7U2M0_9NEIS|nr:hypothetical protein [Neisseria iguanae]PSJ81229.1 hypothetical protein C7N83_01400 [Neisseria iguanae]
MSDLDKFIEKHKFEPKKGKTSVLEPFKEEILQMKKMGFAEKIILQFLAETKNLQVSQQALNRFIRSRSGKIIKPVTEKAVSSAAAPSAPVVIQEKTTEPISNSSGSKFDWQKKIDVNELI